MISEVSSQISDLLKVHGILLKKKKNDSSHFCSGAKTMLNVYLGKDCHKESFLRR